MDLNRATIEIRPRPPYEGLDLGFIMASRWFPRLWGLWLLTALPLSALLFLLCYKAPSWGIMLVWWLKPLFETPQLFWISRKVFNEDPQIRPMIKSLPRILRPHLFWRLTLRRLSPARSFFMPVMLLENMRGKDYAGRTDILGRNQSAGLVLTGICFLFEGVLFFSSLVLFQLLIPETFEISIFDAVVRQGTLYQVLSGVLALFCMSVVSPFYVCAGFALYLSRRTALEAWDIEMNFRRLIRRKQENRSGSGRLAIVLICFMMLICGASDLRAAEQGALRDGRSQAKESIEKVLEDKDFGREKTITYWKLKDIFRSKEKEAPEISGILQKIIDFIRMVVRPLIWACCGVLAVFLVYYLIRHLRIGGRLPEMKKSPPVQELFGLKITRDTLPSDIMAQIKTHLDAHEFRAALSLLYRGTLYRLVFEALVDIPKSATEGECIRIVEASTDPGTASFFKALTRVWLKLAYGHIQPDRATIESLCAEWRRLYGQSHG